jgi:PleD family two-component response regulator
MDHEGKVLEFNPAGGVDYITKPFQKDELLARELADKSKKLEELNARVSENLKKGSS